MTRNGSNVVSASPVASGEAASGSPEAAVENFFMLLALGKTHEAYLAQAVEDGAWKIRSIGAAK